MMLHPLLPLSASYTPKYTKSPLLLVGPLLNCCRGHYPELMLEVSLILSNLCPTILLYFLHIFHHRLKKNLSLLVYKFIVCLSPLEYKPLEGIKLMSYYLCSNPLE